MLGHLARNCAVLIVRICDNRRSHIYGVLADSAITVSFLQRHSTLDASLCTFWDRDIALRSKALETVVRGVSEIAQAAV